MPTAYVRVGDRVVYDGNVHDAGTVVVADDRAQIAFVKWDSDGGVCEHQLSRSLLWPVALR